MPSLKAVLLDLDGTLLDTAQDLGTALNVQLAQHQRPEIPFAQIRPVASYGSKALLKLGFGIDEHHEHYAMLRQEYLAIYSTHSCNQTNLFPGMAKVLEYLTQNNILWGIVTNKPGWLTLPILKALDLINRASCIVCGDTLAVAKPDPAPLLHACKLLACEPNECLYVGDAEFDIVAGRRAQIKTILALYGYLTDSHQASAWGATASINSPQALLKLVQDFS